MTGGQIIGALAVAGFMLFIVSKGCSSTPPSSESTPSQSSSGPKVVGPSVLDKDAIACVSEAAADKAMNLAVTNDNQALGLLLMSRACEVLPAGTSLSFEGGIMTPRYRITGTVQTLYFPASPKLR